MAFVAAYTAALYVNVGTPWTRLAVDNVGQAVAAAFAAWTCWRASLGGRAADRKPWALLGLACASWAIGQTVWSWYELVEHTDPFPSWADVFFLGFVPFAIAGIAGFVRTTAGMASKLRGVLEATMAGAALLYLSWTLLLDKVFHSATTGPVAEWVLTLVYPAADVVVAVVALAAIRRAGESRSHALLFIGAGAVALAVADSAFLYLIQTDAYGPVQGIDAGWVLGFGLIAVGACLPPRTPCEELEAPTGPSRAIVLVPFTAVIPAIALRLYDVRHVAGDVHTQMFYAGLLILVMINVAAIVFENHKLTTTLEQRVNERTEEVRTTERRFLALVQDLNEAMLVCDDHLIIRFASDSAERVLGMSGASLTGEAVTALVAVGDKDRILQALQAALQRRGTSISAVFTLAGSAVQERFMQIQVRNLFDEPAVAGLVVNVREVTEQRRLEEELRSQALRDALTGLPNRTLFMERLDHALARCRRDASSLWVGIIDLDGFKTVNDSLGHHAGDELLQAVAARFDPCLRGNDTVARLGGDEFAILIESGVGGVEVAERLHEALRAPITVAGREIAASASIGLACGSGLDERMELLRQADTAMYAAKARGRGFFAVFEPEMARQAVSRLEMEADLGRALERGQFHLAYQPTVDVATGHVLGFEALLRWTHPERGPVGPGEFVPIAETCGAIVPIGRWVLSEACAQAARWQQTGAPINISVNVSGVQLRMSNLVADVDSALAASGLDPHRLVIELTESVLMDDGPDLVAVLERLRDRGVRVAIDDFGTGYSSLAYLQRLPVDVLKVDKAFVDRLGEGAQADGMVRAIIELAATLSADTVAEGVERLEQASLLQAIGCHAAQGYLFAKPLSPAAATALVKHGASLMPLVAGRGTA